MTVSRHNADQDNTLLTTPTALMLDTRLTPLERNGWQVLRMLRASDGTSSLASLGQLRRYLTSIPLGQKAGYETAWRVLVVLRQRRRPTGNFFALDAGAPGAEEAGHHAAGCAAGILVRGRSGTGGSGGDTRYRSHASARTGAPLAAAAG